MRPTPGTTSSARWIPAIRPSSESKATAAQDLRKAVDQYLGVLSSSRQPAIRERATFALAKAYEALAATRQSEGELEKAVGYYQEVASTWPDGAYAGVAQRRIEDLQRQETKEFYDKFAQYDPQPAYSSPLPGGGQTPPLDFESFDEGNVPDLSAAINPPADESPEPEADEPEPTEGPSLGGDSAVMDKESETGPPAEESPEQPAP